MNKIYFLALTLFICTKTALGWDIAINNQTPFEAHLHIEYLGCQYDRLVIAPRAIVTVNAKECHVSYIEGALVTQRGDSSKNLPLERWTPSKRRNFSIALIEKRYGIYSISPTYFDTKF